MNIIPAIDLLDGKVVRLHKGSYREVTVYSESPLAQAHEFRKAGFNHLHIVDLNGAKEGRFVNLPHIKQIKEELGVTVQTGGGVRTLSDVRYLVKEGVDYIICSSMAIKNEADWLQSLSEFPEHMVLGTDLKEGKIAYSGWLETASESVNSFLLRMQEAGLTRVLCTDISKDGTLTGPNFELYAWLMTEFPALKITASGGVSSIDDLKRLASAEVHSVVVGKAYYEGKVELGDMKDLMLAE
ncbi:MAG: 1-(5-phosphoribosyl)-5-[(5-phosphoribosylamino)methylideneamino]imidazole-4-carboxamide isomerase [Bacteroidota bacterium]